MEYTILNDKYANQLAKKVEAHLKEGWKLQGGVAMATLSYPEGGSRYMFTQALTKKINSKGKSTLQAQSK